jgi:hypothetical protein
VKEAERGPYREAIERAANAAVSAVTFSVNFAGPRILPFSEEQKVRLHAIVVHNLWSEIEGLSGE